MESDLETMKNLVFLLYLVSYTTGIGTLTLLGLFYAKYKLAAFRYNLILELFFTLVLLSDTINFYFQVVINDSTELTLSLILLGFYFASAGMVFYFGKFVCAILNRELNKTSKVIFWSGAILTFSSLIALNFLRLHNFLPGSVAIHSGFTATNIFTVVGIGGFLILLTAGLPEMDLKLRSLIKGFLIPLFILMPASVLSNLYWYKVHSKYPIAFSPVIYFLINILTCFFLYRYYINTSRVDDGCLSPNSANENPLGFHEELIRAYNITGRELEILQMILNGYNNREIGQKLFISANTVRNHIYNIYKKLGIKSRYELIRFFH